MYESARRIRDARFAPLAVFAIAAVASTPVARAVSRGLASDVPPGVLVQAGWFVGAGVLCGYICLQFLAAVPDANEYVDTNPEKDFSWSYAYARAAAKRPFSLLVSSIWLAVLALYAPFLGVSMLFSGLAGIVAATGGLVTMQPASGPDLDDG